MAPGAESIAVMPFSASGPGVEFFGEGMVDLLSTNFDGVAGIRAVDPARWSEAGVRAAKATGSAAGSGSVGIWVLARS